MTSVFSRTLVLILLAATLGFTPGATAGTAQNARVTLDSVRVPAASSIVRTELSGQELAQPQSAMIVLNLRNRAELEARVQKGEIVSLSEMAARYYPTHETCSRVAGWASAQGLAVEPEDTTHMSVVAHGQVAQVANALQARLARVRGDDGKEYTPAVSAPSVPSGIAEQGAGVLRLQPQYHPHVASVYNPIATDGFGPQYLLDQYGATGVGDGPGLGQFGIPDVLSNPRLTLYNSSGGVIASNTGWANAPVPGSAVGTITVQRLTDALTSKVGAFALFDVSNDSAIVATLPPGEYTAQITPAAGDATGIALVEIYELR